MFNISIDIQSVNEIGRNINEKEGSYFNDD